MENDKYKMFKQFMHNELNISKEDIQEWVREAVAEEVNKLVAQSYGTFNIETYIEKSIIDRPDFFYGKGQLTSEIKDKIAKILTEKIEISLRKKNEF